MQWDAFLWPLAVSAALMVAVWVASLIRTDASLVDRFWPVTFMVATATGWVMAGRPGLLGFSALVLVWLWGGRLAIYITVRNWGHGEDRRYAAFRAAGGPRWAYRSLVTVFLLQAVLGWITVAPALALVQTDSGHLWWSVAGMVVVMAGIFVEATADSQMRRFKQDAESGAVMDRGLWRYSRHPNYFGEAVVWWGFYIMALSIGAWWTFYGPLLITLLLLRVSGVTLLEKDLQDRKPAYQDYVRRTSAFIPWKPKE